MQFANGAAYSYVAVVGTGSVSQPWAHNMNAAQITPLVEILLTDLEAHAKKNPAIYQLPHVPPTSPSLLKPTALKPAPSEIRPLAQAERDRIFAQ